MKGLVAATNTTVAGSAGAIVWLLLDYIFTKKVSGLAFCNGALAGLATVTPGSGFIAPWAAFVIGILASMFCRVAIRIKEKLNFDDSFDAWGVHGLGGKGGGGG